MKTTKMSLASIQGKLSRTEMRNIMAGSSGSGLFCWSIFNGPTDQCRNYGLRDHG